MNFAAFERAQVAAFAYREARHTGSIDCMRAMCFILRNRLQSGWGGGSWLLVLEAAGEVAAQEEGVGDQGTGLTPSPQPLASDRLLQLIVRDVDDIYLGQEPWDNAVRQVVCGEGARSSFKKDWKPVLYYSFVDRAPRSWFVENIIHRPQEHPQVGQIGGKMMLYR
jgi:hypothetical protein